MIPIIIINWNGLEDTMECIESVLRLDHTDFQIHLIDNGSDSNQILPLVEKYQGHELIKFHLYNYNFGFTKAHLKIWEEVLQFDESLDYIALLNNDTTVEPNWLSELEQVAKSHNGAMVSSKMIHYHDRTTIDNAGHRMLNTAEILPVGHGKTIENLTSISENFGACAGACLYSTKMLKQIGFFDPYFSTGYEDAELGLRAVIANYLCLYSPNAIVYHKKGESVKKIFNEKYASMIQTSILYAYFKLIPWRKIIVDLPFIFIKSILLIIINIIFWRPKYMKILFQAWLTIFTGWRAIMINRKKAKKKRLETISISKLISKTEFFLLFDIKRFWEIFIKRKESAIDTYKPL